jgi:hypothetical protein
MGRNWKRASRKVRHRASSSPDSNRAFAAGTEKARLYLTTRMSPFIVSGSLDLQAARPAARNETFGYWRCPALVRGRKCRDRALTR